MITLDWDEIDHTTADIRCRDILKWEFVEYIDLFQSPMGTGFHVYVYTGFFDPSTNVVRNLRKIWHDDPKRLKLDDTVRDGSPSILFHYKVIKDVCYHQKFLERFTK